MARSFSDSKICTIFIRESTACNPGCVKSRDELWKAVWLNPYWLCRKFLALDVEGLIQDAACADKEALRSRPIYCGSVWWDFLVLWRDRTGFGKWGWGVCKGNMPPFERQQEDELVREVKFWYVFKSKFEVGQKTGCVWECLCSSS
jgi:hypothetical protein